MLGVRSINTDMKITEVILASKESKDTGSSGTISSVILGDQTQDIVPQDIVPENDLALEVDSIEEQPDHSAIAEGVSQILRRTKGKAPKQGFRCSSGPRKGRIVAKPSTCFMKRDPVKGAKIAKKRQLKAKQAGKAMGVTKRSRGGSRRLSKVQLKTKRSGRGGSGSAPLKKSGKGLQKSRIVR